MSHSIETELPNSRSVIERVQRLALSNPSIAIEQARVINTLRNACVALGTMISGQKQLRDMFPLDAAPTSGHVSQTAEEPDRSPTRPTGSESLEEIRRQELRALRDKREELDQVRGKLRDAESGIQHRRKYDSPVPGYFIAERDNLQSEIHRLEFEIETHEQNIGSTEEMLDGQEDLFWSESSSLVNPDNHERVHDWMEEQD